MGFLTAKQKIFIVAPIFILIVISITLSKTDKNYYKYEYFDQHFQGKVISNKYDENSHFQKIEITNSNNLFLEDLKIIVLIKEGDSIIKKRNTTYFDLFKSNGNNYNYDMYTKKLKKIK